jgi:hypothetical protein
MANHPHGQLTHNTMKINGLLGSLWVHRVNPFGVAALVVFLGLPGASIGAISLPSAPGIRVINSGEVLQSYTEPLAPSGLAFRDASGALVRLVLSVDDPEIRNRGDGAFHAADEDVVLQALHDLPSRYLRSLQVDIYLLPYPRAGFLSSSADSRAIYLSPGVRDYSADQVAFLVTHEIGHIVHRRVMPDSSTGLWAEWAALRGAGDPSIFNETASHAFRPHEIFAEDFRVLFGGPAARGNGAIENPDLPLPGDVPGLRAFYERIVGASSLPAVATLSAWPNPMRAGQEVVLRLPGSDDRDSGGLPASLVDVSGRQVASLVFRPEGGSTFRASLGTTSGTGDGLAAGAYWLRVTTQPGAPLATVPIRILR